MKQSQNITGGHKVVGFKLGKKMNGMRNLFTSAMLIWIEAWSFAPIILLLAELQSKNGHMYITSVSFNSQWIFQDCLNASIANNIQKHVVNSLLSKMRIKEFVVTIYEGRTGPRTLQRRSAWCRFVMAVKAF